MQQESRVAILTGGNRGLGFETCRQLAARGYRVILASRDASKGAAAVERLRGAGRDVTFLRLNVTDGRAVVRLRDRVVTRFGRADVLITNVPLSTP